MPRPRRLRKVGFSPDVTYFKPQGVPMRDLGVVNLSLEELEALRLKDFLGLGQIEAAQKMEVSQPTFHRLLLDARRKVSCALVEGKALEIKK